MAAPPRQPAGLWDDSATDECFSTNLDLEGAAPLLEVDDYSTMLQHCACDLALEFPDDPTLQPLREAMDAASQHGMNTHEQMLADGELEAARLHASNLPIVAERCRNLSHTSQRFLCSKEVFDRDKVKEDLTGVLNCHNRECVVLMYGGKSTGKSFLLKNFLLSFLRSSREVLFVSGCDGPRTLQEHLFLVLQPRFFTRPVFSLFLCLFLALFIPLSAVTFTNWPRIMEFYEAVESTVPKPIVNFVVSLLLSSPFLYVYMWKLRHDLEEANSVSALLDIWLKSCEWWWSYDVRRLFGQRYHPILVIDEINALHPAVPALNQCTQADHRMSVLMVTSEHSFSFGDEARTVSNTVNYHVDELDPQETSALLRLWGVGPYLASTMMNHYGGHMETHANALLGHDRDFQIMADAMPNQYVRKAVEECLFLNSKRYHFTLPVDEQAWARARVVLHLLAKHGVAVLDESELDEAISDFITKMNVAGAVETSQHCVKKLPDHPVGISKVMVPTSQAIRLIIATKLVKTEELQEEEEQKKSARVTTRSRSSKQ